MASTPQSMLSIISSGLEDISRLNPIKGQPSPTFYKTVINRKTRWASQWRRVEFDNIADFGRTATVTLPILGELISRAVLVVVLPDIVGPQEAALAAAKATFGTSADPAVAALQSSVYPAWSWTNSIGHALCSNISMTLSNSPIDSFDSRLLEVIDEFHAPFDHFDTTNFLIGRDPSSYNPLAYNSRAKILGQTKTVIQSPQTVQVVPPFWWNRGPGPQALPIQALAKDKVQLTCTFRPAQSVIYTDARVPGPPVTGTSNIPVVAGSQFYYPDSGGPVTLSQYGRDLRGLALPDVAASPVPGTMPELHFTDAYWIVEYISLEDREAAAFRLGDLTYPIETHVALPVAPTNGAARTRIEIEQGGLVRDLTWVAQRVEATDYNAYFLFSRDLAPQGSTPSETPWWPNAVFPTWDFGDGYITTGFSSTRSDPLLSAMLTLGSKSRFEFSGPSLFRSLLPALNCKKAPLVNRYIYRYDFGLWPTGGLAEASDRPIDEIRGSANWDRIPTKELEFYTADDYYAPTYTATSPVFSFLTNGFNQFYGNDSQGRINQYVDAYQITMNGAGGGHSGQGASLSFILDNKAIQNVPGFVNLFVRTVPDGSIALVLQTNTGYSYIAVAGSGGMGSNGGSAGTVLTTGAQGGPSGGLSHAINGSGLSFGGGGGGGRSYANMPASVLKEGPGLPDGSRMTTDAAFVSLLTKTGGLINGFQGGDGYYGGGSGTLAGGGGGSYVSTYCSNVVSSILPVSYNTFGTNIVFRSPIMTVQTLRLNTHKRPSYNIYMWLTTYNILRINGGRGALLFQV